MKKILSLTTEQANRPKPGMMPQVGDVVIIYSKEHLKTAMEMRYNFRTT